MPLLAVFIGSIASALASFFARFLTFNVAIKLAAFLTWLGVLSAFVASVYVCINSLYQVVSNTGGGAGWVSKFWMGLGMFIPGNAGAVLSCMGSVWIATEVYKIRKAGIHNYSK